MKKSLILISFFVGILSLMISSCSKDSDELKTDYSGTYILNMDQVKVAEGTTKEVGMMGNNISISEGENLSIGLFGVPASVGETYVLDENDSPVSIIGKNLLLSDDSSEWYLSVSGSMTRVSSSKFSFEGVCEDLDGNSHSFNGEVESDAFKLIN